MSRKNKWLIIFALFSAVNFTSNAQMIKDSSVEYLNKIGNNDSAIHLIKGLLLKENNSLEIRCNLQMKLANRYLAIPKYDSAIWYANKFIAEQEPKTKFFLPKLYNIKAGGYYYMFNLDKGMESLEKGIYYAEQIGDSNSLTVMSSNLGAMLADRQQFEKAEANLLKALKYNKKTNEGLRMQFYLTKRLLGTTYEFLKRNKEAEQNYLEALDGLKENKILGPAYFGALTFYARFLSKQKRSKEAFEYLNKSIEVSKSNNNQKDLSALYYVTSLVYKESSQKDSAIAFLDRAYANQLVEFQQEQSATIATSEAKFGNEILKRDAQIAKINKEKLYFVITLLIFIALLSWISFYFYQKRKDARAKLELQKQTIDAYMDGEEKEKVRLSRELHDGIAQDLLALHFALKRENISVERLNEIDKIGQEVRGLSHQLMPLTLKMLGLVPAMEEICNRALSSTNISYEFKTEGIKDRLPLKLETSLYRIFQELIQNIVKHSKASEVMVQLLMKNNSINLIVEDNGLGFEESKQKNGLGLHNLKSRIQMINGQLKYESENGNGTVIIVRVPLAGTIK